MTLGRCQHTGDKLPDNVSCGATCNDFPNCLPPLPSYLPDLLAQLQASNDAEHGQVSAAVEALILLRAAIVRGLAEQDEHPDG